MLISCGAAVFGLRLAVRSLGCLPVVELLPEPARLRLLARVRPGQAAPMTAAERKLLEAVPHRHTHRGRFEPAPLPSGLLAGLQHDVVAEGATLVLADEHALARLAAITGTGRLRQRDFDLGRGFGLLTDGGPSPPASAALLTSGDGRADWLRAGQALYRLLLHAASRWVFAALYTQPLEAAATRKLIKTGLALPGWPQVLLQLGVARTTQAMARRPAGELLEP